MTVQNLVSLNDKVNCGDMKLDKFGNLFYVDRNVQAIVKIVSANLTNPVTNTKAQIVYSANETEKMRRVEAITIEREYLYWTNV